ncbi:MAG: hypothetical protein F6K03_16795 [Kamptonema sp. SIO4C4]|nr:hypothetical protein [Kamptonema sp. SIO4C4]
MLQFIPTQPPELLYHGTGATAVPAIQQQGLQKMSRHHVHLSCDRATAKKVGQRHGKPAIFQVKAQKLYQDKLQFYCTANNVWLVDHVPPQYLLLLTLNPSAK